MGSLLVPAYYLVAKRKRRGIERGLGIMFRGEPCSEEVEKLVHSTLDNSIKTFIEGVSYSKLDKNYCEKNVEYIGLENLDGALEQDRGVVLLHGHLGNPHLIMPAIGYMGYKLSQLATRNRPKQSEGAMSWIINRIRNNIYELDKAYKESLPVNFIYVDRFLRAPFEILKRNEILAIGMDGREGVKSVEIGFLGHRAIFYTGSMRLIMRAKPVVLPTFHVRNRNNTHKIIIEKPMEIQISGNRDKDIICNIERFVNMFEKYVYKYPGLYADAFCLKESYLLEPTN